MLSATATPYIPFSHVWTTLSAMPFFTQRLDHFARWTLREYDAGLKDLTDIRPCTDAAFPGQIFQATFRGRQLVYEARSVSDPRTGRFRVLQ